LATGWLPAYGASSDLTYSATTDTDGDGVFDNVDNCTLVPNAGQIDTNNNGYGNVCDGDLNFDHFVNALDLGLFKSAYAPSNLIYPEADYDPNSDFNSDGVVNDMDKSLLYTFFAKPPGPGAPRSVAIITDSGHGVLFDTAMHALNFDQQALLTMQDEILSLLTGSDANCFDTSPIQATLTKFGSTISQQQNNPNPGNLLFLQGAEINLLLSNVNGSCSSFNQDYYKTRNLWIIYQAYSRYGMPQLPAVQSLLLLGGLIPALAPAPAVTYEQKCKDAGVPIPPTLDLTANPPKPVNWSYQGNLTAFPPLLALGTNNLLQPGKSAQVFTHTDANLKGACIALPRTEGGAYSLSGIICQSYTTGNACFWDSTVRPDAAAIKNGIAGVKIDWTKNVLYPVQDGANKPNMTDGDTFEWPDPTDATGMKKLIAEGDKCTDCHTGSTVYNILPDYPVWKKVIQTLKTTANNANFNTQIDPNAKLPKGASKFNLYNPVNSLGWKNPPIPVPAGEPKSCQNCHEYPNNTVNGMFDNLEANNNMPAKGVFDTNPTVQMPPVCKKNCY
jgi:hypothetical protein